MRRLRFTPAAMADLDTIWDYTANRWDEAQAERYLGAIRDACEALAAGRRAPRSAEAIRPGYGRLPVGSHIIYCRSADPGMIEVVRVLHERMDPDRHVPARS
jgi:toxin ParE1/3/4